MANKNKSKPSFWDKFGELMLKSQTTSPTSVSGGDAYGARAMQAFSEGDVEKAKEIQREEDTKAAMAMGTAAIIPEMAVTGMVPTLVTTAAGLAGGYVGNKVGSYLDKKLDTKWIAPTFSILGGLGSGIGSYKGLVNAGTKGLLKGNSIMYGKNFVTDVINNFADNNLKQLSINGPLRHYTRYITMHPDYDEILSETNLYDTLTGKNIAQLSTFKNNHFDVSRIENIVGENGVKGKSRDLYSSELLENMEGALSGMRLLQPHKTIPTWKHFKHKIVGYFGDHGLEETNNGPIALLQYPERYIPNVESKIQLASPIIKPGNKKVYWTMHPEQPSTYFKTAKYPVSSKSYNGKEVPAWQLPKGERNQHYNPTATERVFSVLGRDSKIKTKGVTDLELKMDSDALHNYYALHNFLKTHGVNTSNITLNDLKALHNNRINAISELDNYNITSPASMGMKHLSWFTRGYDKEGLIGSILTTGDAFHNGAKIDMVRNLTTKSGTRPGFDPELIVNKSRTKIHDVSPRMYDAGIVVAKQTGNGRGIISGNMLAHPEITIKKWDMYPDKIVLGNYGQHDWNGELRSGPVVLLPTPRSNTIPTKSTLFYPSVIKNGKITTERNHKSIFKKYGGKLKETK